MYLYCDCSLQRPKRGIQAARGFQPVLPSAGLSASVTQRRAFSQCTAMAAAPLAWRGTDSNEAPPKNYQAPTCVRLPEEEACQRNKGR